MPSCTERTGNATHSRTLDVIITEPESNDHGHSVCFDDALNGGRLSTYTKKDTIALQIINLAKAEILAKNHFLANAVGRLLVEPASLGRALSATQTTAQFTTDGERLGFDANAVVERFSAVGGKSPKHDLLHTVVHCVFLHPFVGKKVDENLWNLAADMAAERVVIDLLGPREDKGIALAKIIDMVERDLGGRATAERIYGGLREGRWAAQVSLWQGLFFSDEHTPWYAYSDSSTGFSEGESDKGSEHDKTNTRGPESGNDEQRMGKGTPPDKKNVDKPHAPSGQNKDDDNDGDGSANEAPKGEQPSSSNEKPQEAGPEDGPRSLAPDSAKEAAGEKRSPESTSGGDSDPNPRNSRAPEDQSAASSIDGDSPNNDASNPGDTPSFGFSEVRAQGEGEGRLFQSYASQRRGLGLARTTEQVLDDRRDEWRDVALRLAIDLETYSRETTSALSGFVGEVKEASEKPFDFREFLRQFAAYGEVMRLSDDEFDNVFYTYGMSLFGNVPLIEPLETREEKRIREFVIAIDTSGSVRGNIVRAFVDTVFDILKTAESFHERIHLRILQCDAAVQSDDTITSLDDVREWHRAMRIYGGGGTDFRPVFHYVENLIEEGAFSNLGGLLYFTDGWGTYPEWRPSYRTAFVFFDENHRRKSVPPWAITATLDSSALGPLESLEPVKRGEARVVAGTPYDGTTTAPSSMSTPAASSYSPASSVRPTPVPPGATVPPPTSPFR